MSEFEEEYEYDAYYEEPATAEDQLTEVFLSDPVGTISLVANAAAEQRAQEFAAQAGGQIKAIESQYAGNVAAQSSTMAIERMEKLYGSEFSEARPKIGRF